MSSGRRGTVVDIHAHLLPGVDDGPDSLTEAVAMCRRAAAAGCRAMIATPHQRHHLWWNDDVAALAALRDELSAALGDEIAVHLGAEVRVDDRLLEALDRAPASGVLALAGSRYLLLEFDRRVPFARPGELVHELVVGGWRPILAHPEQILWLADDLPLLGRLVELGATVQVTADSLAGAYGRRSLAISRAMLEAGLVHFAASDTHDLDHRPPNLADSARAIAERFGEPTAHRLTVANPSAVLADEPLPAAA